MSDPAERGAVLDASAVLALLFNEPGSSRVRARLAAGVVGAVNAAEILSKLADRGMPGAAAEQSLSLLGLRIEPFTFGQAVGVARLRALTRAAGLSLGDRACLVLGAELGLDVLTADRSWAGVADIAGVAVELVR